MGELKNIFLICGTGQKLLYAYEQKRFEYIEDLKHLTPEILKTEITQMIHRQKKRSIKNDVVLYKNTKSWIEIYPHRYLHKWVGNKSCRRVYIISVSLRSGVGGWYKLH